MVHVVPRWLRFGLAALGLSLLVAGCGTEAATTTSSVTASTQLPSSTTTAPPTTTTLATTPSVQVSAFFVQDEKIVTVHREVPKTLAVGEAAMKALLAGPTTEEKAAGCSGAIPPETSFLGLTIANGVATVDLSGAYASGGGSFSMFLRLAQVVYTLTQFPTISGVNFSLDGEPVTVFSGEGLILDHPQTRADYEDVTPAIFVASPAFGDLVTDPARIFGTANVFEAVFKIDIEDSSGTVLTSQVVTASSGTGERGTFDVTIPLDSAQAGTGTIVVYSDSPKDGSRINEVRIPVRFSP